MSRYITWGIVGAISVVTMATLWWATATYGIGASTDTITYLSVAQNVLAGNGFVSYDGGAMVEFPPIYPLLLCALLCLLPVPALSAMKFLSVLCAGGCNGVAAYLLQRCLHYSVARWVGLALLLFSVPLWSVYVMGWSEPPFIFFTLLLFVALIRYLQMPSMKQMFYTAGVSSLCILTRYAGICPVVVGAIGIGWGPLSCKWERLRRVALYLLLVFGTLGLWLVRNLCVSGTLMGERVPSERGFFWNLEACRRVLDGWFLPGAAIPIVAFLLLGTIMMLMQACRSPSSSILFRDILRLQVLFTSYVVVYLMLLVLSASRVAYDEPDNRLLAPIYVPLLLALLGVGEFIYSRFFGNIWLKRVVTVLAILFALAPVSSTINLLKEVHDEGVDFTSVRWWKSPSLAFLRQYKLDAPLYSNCPEAIYLHTGRPAELLPRRFYYATHLPVKEDIRDFAAEVREQRVAYLLWFLSEPTGYLYSPQQLTSVVTLHLERRFADADLFRVVPCGAALKEGVH